MLARLRIHLRAASARARRGNYSPMMGILIFIVVGFGAMSVDVSLMTMANLQAQATADAAAHAALVGFNQNKSVAEAMAAAEFVRGRNKVALGYATLDAVQIGQWTFDAATPAFVYPIDDIVTANAARAFVSRKGVNAVNTLLGGLIGVPRFEVDGVAVAAQRQRAIMLVLDLSGSMMSGGTPGNQPVDLLRDGTQLLYEYMLDRPQSGDMIGIATFATTASRDPANPLPWSTKCGAPGACDRNPSDPWLSLVEMDDPRIQERINGICDTNTDTAHACTATGGAPKAEQSDIGGLTAPHHALNQAIHQLTTNVSDRYYRAILFMSDGVPTAEGPSDSFNAAQLAGENGIVIFGVTVTNGGSNDPVFVDTVVSRGAEGGFNQVSDDAANLPFMFEEVARRLPTVFTE